MNIEILSFIVLELVLKLAKNLTDNLLNPFSLML